MFGVSCVQGDTQTSREVVATNIIWSGGAQRKLMMTSQYLTVGKQSNQNVGGEESPELAPPCQVSNSTPYLENNQEL